MNPTKAYWQERLLSHLPPEHEIRARNAAINASYAAWFLRHPDWFRWSGMAAFASYRVGMLLAIYDFSYVRGDEFISEPAKGNLLNDARIMCSVEELRKTNNEVFADAGWAHLAYESPEGGIEAVEEGLKDDPAQIYQLKAFREIERARKMAQADAAEPSEINRIFWHAGHLLLKNEQWGVVEKHFPNFDFPLGLGLTAMTSLDFDANHLARSEETYCEFYWFLWTRGLHKLLRTFSLPNIMRLEHRWFWIEKSVLPTWKKVYKHDKNLTEKMQRIVRSGEPFDPEVYSPAADRQAAVIL